jgi:hypothetical protein
LSTADCFTNLSFTRIVITLFTVLIWIVESVIVVNKRAPPHDLDWQIFVDRIPSNIFAFANIFQPRYGAFL